ncbi:MAG: DUF3341 domain-containing protein [Pseudomonadota bacterium]
MTTSVMGLFDYEDDFLAAARKLKDAGISDLTLMSPIPLHDAEKVLGLGSSAIRRFYLIGAIIGAVSGFALATFSALSFILPTGGRAIIAIPPFLVITYELTILFGVIATLIGFHVVSGLPAWRDKPYDEQTNVNQFSVSVELGEGKDADRIGQIMSSAGAVNVKQVEV